MTGAIEEWVAGGEFVLVPQRWCMDKHRNGSWVCDRIAPHPGRHEEGELDGKGTSTGIVRWWPGPNGEVTHGEDQT